MAILRPTSPPGEKPWLWLLDGDRRRGTRLMPFGLAYDLPGRYNPAIRGLRSLPVVAGVAVLAVRLPRLILAADAVFS